MKKVIFVITLLLIAILVFVGYSGFFHSVEISHKEMGPFFMILKKHTGSYYKTGAVFDEVGTVLKNKLDIEKLNAVGLYYDDPAKVKEDQLRSECGFILNKTELGTIGALKEGLIVKDFKKTICAVGEFPLRSFLSYMIGPSKAYPAFAEYGKGKKFASDFSMEIYDRQAKTILYCMPISAKK